MTTLGQVGIDKAKREAQQRAMYGCTEAECRKGIDQHVEFFHHNANMALGSILSDVQELIAMGHSETARQYLNRVKMAIFEAQPIKLWKEGA